MYRNIIPDGLRLFGFINAKSSNVNIIKTMKTFKKKDIQRIYRHKLKTQNTKELKNLDFYKNHLVLYTNIRHKLDHITPGS